MFDSFYKNIEVFDVNFVYAEKKKLKLTLQELNFFIVAIIFSSKRTI